MGTPEFVRRLRERIGTDPLWLPGATAVVLRGESVLLVRRSDDGEWTPVTGIVDPGELPSETAVREVLEETGVSCTVEALVQVSVTEMVVYPNGDQVRYLDHTLRCRYSGGDPHPADDESTDAGWFPLADLPPMAQAYRQRVFAARHHTGPTLLGAPLER